jgi:shikimate dehydrogenase
VIELGLVGDDIEESLSPRIHAAAMESAGIEGRYDLFPVDADGLEGVLAAMRRSSAFVGLNVTIPFKQAVIPLLDDVSREAEAIGAVNTVTKAGTKLSGDNTDHTGFLLALEDAGFDVRRKRVLVLGAGGAARALLFGLGRAGAAGITICARNRKQAELLAARFSSFGTETSYRAEAFEAAADTAADEPPDLVVNATPVGSGRLPGLSPLPRCGFLSPRQLVADIVYRPATTPLLDEARVRGARTMNGLPMLVHQALESFRIWTGKRVAAKEVISRLQLGVRRQDHDRRETSR